MERRTRFALVGTGRITDWVLKGARQDERFEAVAICSRHRESGEAFARKHGIPYVFTDVEEMASSPLVDAVYIGTPNHTHASIAITCLKAGKHVLCEKPLAASAKEAEQMVREARKSGVILMEAMMATLNPNFLEAVRMMPRVGPVRSYSAFFCQYSSKYDALKQGTVASSFDPLCAGGALMDIGIYTIWPMVVLFGEPDGIVADIRTLWLPDHGLTDLQGTALFRYPGMTASVQYSKISDSFLPSEIAGENGNLLLDRIHNARHLEWHPHGAPSSGRGEEAPRTDYTVPLLYDEYYYEFREFITCIAEGCESEVNSPERSVAVLRILDEIRRQMS